MSTVLRTTGLPDWQRMQHWHCPANKLKTSSSLQKPTNLPAGRVCPQSNIAQHESMWYPPGTLISLPCYRPHPPQISSLGTDVRLQLSTTTSDLGSVMNWPRRCCTILKMGSLCKLPRRCPAVCLLYCRACAGLRCRDRANEQQNLTADGRSHLAVAVMLLAHMHMSVPGRSARKPTAHVWYAELMPASALHLSLVNLWCCCCCAAESESCD